MTASAGTMPRDVVFDLGGVLVDWDPRYLLCGELGFTRTEADDLLERVCSREWHARLDGGRRFDEAGAELIAAHPEHAGAIRAYTRDWEKMFAGEFRATARLLGALKRAGFRLHALSNYPGERIAFLYRRFEFMREFDTVVLSGLIGTRKPEARIFEYLFERIGTRDCVFLDDRADNVAAAQAYGVRAVCYTPPADDAAGPLAVLEHAGLGNLLGARLRSSNQLV